MNFMDAEFKQRLTALYDAAANSENEFNGTPLAGEAKALYDVCVGTGMFPYTRRLDHVPEIRWWTSALLNLTSTDLLGNYLGGLAAYITYVKSPGSAHTDKAKSGICAFIARWLYEKLQDDDAWSFPYDTWELLHQAGICQRVADGIPGPTAQRIAEARRLYGVVGRLLELA